MESAEACVTTHLLKRAAPKTDDAKASVCPLPILRRRNAARDVNLVTAGAATCRGTQGPCGAVHDVSRCGTVYGADLGCSSSYSIGRLRVCLRTGVWSRLPCQQQLNTDESVVSQVPDARVWEKAGCYTQAWRTENRSKIPIRRVVEPMEKP